MKKILLIVSLLLFVSGCSNNTTTIKKDSKQAGIHEIDYLQLQDKLNNKDTFILYIGRPDCGDCKEFYPILESYIKEQVGSSVYYLNVKAVRDASRKDGASKEEVTFFENIKEELDFTWTPTLKFIDGGKIIDSYTYLDEEYYEIEDKEKQKEVKQEFIKDFNSWMNIKFE